MSKKESHPLQQYLNGEKDAVTHLLHRLDALETMLEKHFPLAYHDYQIVLNRNIEKRNYLTDEKHSDEQQ